MEIIFPRHTITTLPDISVNLSDKICQDIYPFSPLYAIFLVIKYSRIAFHTKDVTNELEKANKWKLNDIQMNGEVDFCSTN